jgi:hypothetical protein
MLLKSTCHFVGCVWALPVHHQSLKVWAGLALMHQMISFWRITKNSACVQEILQLVVLVGLHRSIADWSCSQWVGCISRSHYQRQPAKSAEEFSRLDARPWLPWPFRMQSFYSMWSQGIFVTLDSLISVSTVWDWPTVFLNREFASKSSQDLWVRAIRLLCVCFHWISYWVSRVGKDVWKG